VPTKSTVEPKDESTQDCNVGTKHEPKLIKLSRDLTPEIMHKYIDLFKEYMDFFAWKYEDLKTYDTSIIQHIIHINPGIKPFRQKLRQVNLILLPIVEKEVRNILDAKIIIPLRYFEWVGNLVLVRNKNGEIILCVNFKNMNKCSLKDNYPLPKIEHILQRVVQDSRISMMDGCSRYNQVAMHLEDRDKTTFTTPSGTFMYNKMPFGLINAGATFERAMDIAFVAEKDRFIFIYLDDMIVFSNSDQYHLKHLRQTFIKCIKYGISLNPKKSLFSMREGKFIGHIVSQEGVIIGPKRVKSINTIGLPKNKK
jgi:hypothetical protein